MRRGGSQDEYNTLLLGGKNEIRKSNSKDSLYASIQTTASENRQRLE